MNWYKLASRSIEEHIRGVVDADLDSPIFITDEYEIIDGAHRVCKAYILEQTIQGIILTQEDLNSALLPEKSSYVGQIYRDDDKNEYSVTKLKELYANRQTITLDPKDVLDHSEKVWGSSVDIYHIIEEAKRKMAKSKEVRKKAKIMFSLSTLWSELTKHFSSPKIKALPQRIGKINDMVVYLVDGDKVKKEKNMDYVEGGHDLVYDFIPDNEIWVDASMSPDSIPHIIYHEYIERYLMNKYDISYDDAHEIANKEEKKII